MAKIKNHLGRNFNTERTDDKISSNARSLLMSKIKGKGTSFEQAFFDVLRHEKIRFIEHPKEILGKPDLIVKKTTICVFLDSNFWHGWQYPRWKHKLKNDFWREKIERNRMRDKKVTASLRRQGYIVLRFWEHQIKNDVERCILKLKAKIEEYNHQ